MGEATGTKVVVVTGASAGIGRACADRLAADGWTVVGASRRGTGGAVGTWDGLVMDVTLERSVSAGIELVLARHGRVDALVAAAGWGVAGAFEHTTLSEARAQVETNFWGVVRTVQAVLPTMRSRRSGRIVLLSSIGGVIGLPFQSFYSASKFAVEGLAESMAYEVSPFGIAVSLVQPGNFRTDFTDNRQMAAAAGDDPVYGAALAKAISVMERDERNGAPADGAAAAVARLLATGRPPRRVSVGKAGERVGVLAKRVLPFRLFETAAKGSLGVG